MQYNKLQTIYTRTTLPGWTTRCLERESSVSITQSVHTISSILSFTCALLLLNSHAIPFFIKHTEDGSDGLIRVLFSSVLVS